ncbi:MAG: DHH family phosphoesterase, partial [Candidatus Bathyarchaeota archaeon]|nr:DHH family phosphoesterase [Candidatus Bathyarchaeota archaeon]
MRKLFSMFLGRVNKKTLEKFKKIVRGKNIKFCTIFCHHNADPDAIYSAYLTFKLVKYLNPKIECEIVVDQNVSKISKALMLRVPVPFKEELSLEKTDLVIIVDTSTFKQLDTLGKSLEKLDKPLIVLDHHEPHPKTMEKAYLMLVNPKASSTCEIVYNMCKNVKVKLGKDDAWGLLAGIVYETKGFRYASSKTLRV